MAIRPAILKNEMLFEKSGEQTDDPAGEQRAAERAPFDGLKVTKAEKAERQNDACHQTDAVIAGFALVNVKAEFCRQLLDHLLVGLRGNVCMEDQ